MFTNNMEAIEHVFAPLEGRTILDIGCGRGRLLRALSRRGALPTGLDPNPNLLEKAREMAPGVPLHESGGESLPFADASFDGAIFLNSLHHIPQDLIAGALEEGFRVIRPGCALMIVEPLARGGYHEIFAPIDDETEVRTGALAHLDAFLARKPGEVILHTEFDTWLREDSVDAMLEMAVAIGPERAARVEGARDEVVTLFSHHARETEGGYLLDQPMIAVAVRKAP